MVGIQAQNLAVNDGPLTSENAALLRPSDPSMPIEELRQRYEQDGYLFVKGLLPREDVLEMRRRYFDFLAPTGVLQQNTDPVEGIFNKTKSPTTTRALGPGMWAITAVREAMARRSL